jgi:phosphopantothenoylcysteine decarboxylase / phosphopantothenate---cysteine ligase
MHRDYQNELIIFPDQGIMERMPNPLQSKHILLGVTGSIACYKAADLASKLAQAGSQVDVILTAAARQFLTPLTFQSVTGRRAFTDDDLWGGEAHVLHVGLGHNTDLLIIAPATANTLAKLAHGIADNLLSITALAAACPLLIAPAMDGGMYAHPATQANLEILRGRGAVVVGPAVGHLASGLSGVGRMVEPAEVLGQARLLLARGGPLAGRRVVVTAGGTQEPLDPVRVIANRSSGKQGMALAQAALDLGAQVTVIAGPIPLPAPPGARRVDVSTTQEMLEAVLAECALAEALLMAAAPADFRSAAPASQKIKKEAGAPHIQLAANPDILSAVAHQKSETGFPRVTVGFAAESQDLLENAQHKLETKKLDIIAANDISAGDAGFSVDTNRVTLLFAGGRVEALPLLTKAEVADVILERVLEQLKM